MFKIEEDGTIIRDDNLDKKEETEEELLYKEYKNLEYEVLNNHHNPTKDPVKIARYNELKKKFYDESIEIAIKKLQNKLKQDKNPNKSADIVFSFIEDMKKRGADK